MSKKAKKNNQAVYVYVLCLAGMFGAWRGGELIDSKLKLLPINDLPPVAAKPVATSTSSFYPIFLKHQMARQAEMQANGISVENAFRKAEEAKPIVVEKPKEIDYVALVKQTALLQSVADNGAVINGRFYAVGESLNEMAVLRPGAPPLLPRLTHVAADHVVLSVGGAPIELRLPKLQ